GSGTPEIAECRRFQRGAQRAPKQWPAALVRQHLEHVAERRPGDAQEPGPADRLPQDEEEADAERTEERLSHASSAAVRSSTRRWNCSLRITDGSRGRANGTLTSRTMRPGRPLITTTRSARNSASSTEWVISMVVIWRADQMRCNSTFICRRVTAS